MNNLSEESMTCYRHPDRETRLRCNRCEKPICVSCAVSTPTGYRCPDCIRGQQKAFETTLTRDYFIAAAIALPMSFIGSYIATYMGFFTLFIAPISGTIIAEAVRWAVKRRRSQLLFRVATASAAIGSLPIFLMLLVLLLFSLVGGELGLGGFWGLLWQGIYTTLVSSTVYYRLSGIQLGKYF